MLQLCSAVFFWQHSKMAGAAMPGSSSPLRTVFVVSEGCSTVKPSLTVNARGKKPCMADSRYSARLGLVTLLSPAIATSRLQCKKRLAILASASLSRRLRHHWVPTKATQQPRECSWPCYIFSKRSRSPATTYAGPLRVRLSGSTACSAQTCTLRSVSGMSLTGLFSLGCW